MNVESSLVHCLFLFLNMFNICIVFNVITYLHAIYVSMFYLIYTSMPILRFVSSCKHVYIYIYLTLILISLPLCLCL